MENLFRVNLFSELYPKDDIISTSRKRCETCANSRGPECLLLNSRNVLTSIRENSIPMGPESDICFEGSLASPQRHRYELSLFIALKRSLLAPIRILPDEILCDILLLAQKSNMKEFNRVRDQYTLIRAFSEVSSHWHSIVTSYPFLWSNITLEIDDYADLFQTRRRRSISKRMANRFIEKCMFHSKEVPLKIKFGKSFTFKGLENNCIKELVRSVCRWEVITIWRDALQEIVHRIPKGTMLTSLKLELKHMSCPSMILLHFPWSQIIHFVSRDNFFLTDELVSILEAMPKLTIFEFLGKTSISKGKCITLPNLQSLTLRGVRALFLTNAIITPRLHSLDLTIPYEYGGGIRNVSYTSIIQFLRKSACSLEELTLRGVPLSSREWHVKELRKVKKLHLSTNLSGSAREDILDLTKKNSFPFCLFPAMETLHLHIHSNEGLVSWHVIIMLASRLPPYLEALARGLNMRTLHDNVDIDGASYLRQVTVDLDMPGVLVDIKYRKPEPSRCS
ncbi:hypothetical protein BDQ17DRAFT_1372767 [Cyathus striatus]|nr:hypothetical protein BDQ17DRAFT_1372767 [Cyathus striatus]